VVIRPVSVHIVSPVFPVFFKCAILPVFVSDMFSYRGSLLMCIMLTVVGREHCVCGVLHPVSIVCPSINICFV